MEPGGQGMDATFVFKVDGENLSGTMTFEFGEVSISEGSVKGDDVSFVILAFGGQFKLSFSGKAVSDDELRLTVATDTGNMELTARRIR